MGVWYRFEILKHMVQKELQRAYLIKMPDNSAYQGYSFWHPVKLIKKADDPTALALLYTLDWKFKIIKYGAEREILDSKVVPINEFLKALRWENVCANGREDYKLAVDYEMATHKPENIKPIVAIVPDDLKADD